jgi:hypothetical protein
MKIIYAFAVAVLFFALPALAQTNFQNLNFEAATDLPVVSQGNAVLVPVANALPEWTVFEGGAQQSQMFYNGVSLGAPLVTLVGPNSGPPNAPFPPLAGSYSATLDDGEGGDGTAAIAQTGTVPMQTESLQFLANGDVSDIFGYLSVSFNGQNLPIFTLTTGPNSDLYGCDLSGLAGQTGELQFTENPSTRSAGVTYLDNIIFSPDAIPEPGTWALMLCGAGLFTFGKWKRMR